MNVATALIRAEKISVRWTLLIGVGLAWSAPEKSAAESARPGYRKMSITADALHLLIPMGVVKAELALGKAWGASLRGGYGKHEAAFTSGSTEVLELGFQGIRYFGGRFDRGFQAGCDIKISQVSQRDSAHTLIFGLGDAVALGPFLGYKRAYRVGFTLESQIGMQWAMGQYDENPLMLLALSAGWSFWRVGGSEPIAAGLPSSAETAAAKRGPMGHHQGFLVGFSLGGGVMMAEGCGNCEFRPGIAVNTSVGWFLGRRLALLYDGATALGLAKSAPVSMASTLQGPALQYWPHRDFWLKAGIGYARLLAAAPFGTADENGGGMTLAVGYEFHRAGNHAMDVQLRATHTDFDSDSTNIGIDAISLLLGWNWD